jgi:V/A-type H+-transporting ATPase subunit D
LQEVKKRITLSQTGYSLLRKKRDALMMELFSAIERAKDAREELESEYDLAREKIAEAQATDGIAKLKSAAFARTDTPRIVVKTQNIMGIEVPHISETSVQRKIFERGYGIGGTSSRIDEASTHYERVLEKVMIAAEVETIIKKVLSEIERTKRRVNALEYKIIPDLQETQKIIQMHLNERERESLFVVKRIKKGMKGP